MSLKQNEVNSTYPNKPIISKSFQHALAFGICGFASVKLSQKLLVLKNMKKLKQVLQDAIHLNENRQIKYSNDYFAFAQGTITNKNVLPQLDQFFGVESSNKDCLGLYRKIEIYNPLDLSGKKFMWKNINFSPLRQYEQYLNYIQSKVFVGEDVRLNNLHISNDLLVSLAENNSKQLNINEKNINKNFDKIKYEFENLMNQIKNDQQIKLNNQQHEIQVIQGLYNKHPFKYSNLNNKLIYYENNYIYISSNKEKLTEGDIRISFYDIKQIAEVTILAMKKDGFFDISTIPDLNYEVKIYDDKGIEQTVTLGLINFIEKGIIPNSEFINFYVSRLGKNTKYETLFYIFLICFFLNLAQSIAVEEGYKNQSPNKLYKKYNPFENLSYLSIPMLLGGLQLFVSGRIVSAIILLSFTAFTQFSLFLETVQRELKKNNNQNQSIQINQK